MIKLKINLFEIRRVEIE